MILQALNAYYSRKCNHPDPSERLPLFGLEQKDIPFLLEIDADGQLLQLLDTRDLIGKKKIAQNFLVPIGVKRASGISANLLWDTIEYVLGVDTKGKPDRVREQHAAFCARIKSLTPTVHDDEGIRAVLKFLERIDLLELQRQPAWPDALESNAIVSFRLHGDHDLVCQRPAVVRAFASVADEDHTNLGICLITGEKSPVERLHTSIKGVWGAQTSGANIVSFNARAFESYGKTERQGENAPVSRTAAFAYTTALNHLLRRGSTQRFQVGDASTVFWADKDDQFENIFGELFNDDPGANTLAVQALFDSINTGKLAGLEGETRFHVLGLSPNAARISVRFYHCLTLRDLGVRILQHYKDLEVARGPKDPQYPSLFRLLSASALQNKADNIPPNLGGAIVDAIFSGENARYPSAWLNVAISRCRAEQSVNYLRAATIKACLQRQIRNASARSLGQTNEQEFLPMLDSSNTHPAYLLGRLFSVLEKIQEEASPGLNATIRDRYYGAASSTPVAVFTTLLRLKNAHLKQLKFGRSTYFEKLLGDVLGPLNDFPKHLPLAEQGRFALGYYHQRQDFFTKKSDNSITTNTEGIAS
jgi:CRISPR-associated protein Csd1